MGLLYNIRNLNVDRLDIDDAVELLTVGRLAEKAYGEYQVPAPTWLTDGLQILDREIRDRQREMLLARKREIELQLKSLRTREERKADLQADLAKVLDTLGVKPE